MTTTKWNSAIGARIKRLARLGKLPPHAARHAALRAIAILSLAADAGIRHRLMPASTEPLVALPAHTGRDEVVQDLLAELTHSSPRAPAVS